MFYGQIVYATLAPLAIVGVIVLAILALAGRSEPDTRGERAYVLYLSLVSFVALFTLLFALVDLAGTAADALIDRESAECLDPFSPDCLRAGGEFASASGEQRTRDALTTGGLAAAAGGILLFHRRRSQQLVGDAGFPGTAGARTFVAYLYAVAFTSLVVVLGAAAVALPALVRSVAPGLTAGDATGAERDAALNDLVPALVAGAGGAVIYVTHWRAADRLRPRGED